MAVKQFDQVVAEDAVLSQFDQDEGDIGNWRAVLDGVVCHNTGFEDGTPEPTEIEVVLDDRDGRVATYDSYKEARYTLGLNIPTHQRGVEEALLAGSAVFQDKATAATANKVGAIATPPVAGTSGEEYYLLPVGLTPWEDVDVTIERVGFMSIDPDPDNLMLCVYDATGGEMVDITAAGPVGPGGTLSITNTHKGTIVATACDLTVAGLVLLGFDPADEYFVSFIAGGRKRVDYIDETLKLGDKCALFSLAYTWGALPNATDYQIQKRFSRAKRQQLALYRPLGNSTTSRIWIKRFYPDVRLIRPPAESTATGQNAVNTRKFEYEVRRMRQPSATSDFYVEQHVTYPVA